MREDEFFRALVIVVTCVTMARVIISPNIFLVCCIGAQVCALIGLFTHTYALIRIGHIGFTLAMWIGSLICKGFELGLVVLLLTITLFTRHLLGHCMFSHIRDSNDTNHHIYDLLYAIPLLFIFLRTSYQGA